MLLHQRFISCSFKLQSTKVSYSAKNATVVAADALFAEELQSLKNHERRSNNASPNEIRPIKKS